MGVNAVGIIFTLWSALKRDREKYLKHNEENINDDQVTTNSGR